MKIDNRFDANKYYDIINNLIDEYIDKWKVKPSRLKRYLKPNSKRFDNFISKHNLKDIKGIERVLKDVIEDRVALEKDNVMTFEKYNLLESNDYTEELNDFLYKGLGKATAEMEKYLADVYDSNLSNVKLIDSDRRFFTVNSWSKEYEVVIYSVEDLHIIKENFIDYYYNKLKDKKLKISDEIDIDIILLVNKENFYNILNKKFSIKSGVFLNNISKLLDGSIKTPTNLNNFYMVWELNN